MNREPDAITRLFRACDPNESLQPDDPRYVNCDDVRGERLVEIFARDLRMADPSKPVVKLFAGHRGVGKSSELLRLKALLEGHDTSRRPFKTVLFNTGDSLDLNDLDFPDLLVLLAGELQKQLSEIKIPGFNVETSLFTSVWEGLKGLLGTKVSPTELKVGPGFMNLALDFRMRPNARKQLRDAIELHNTALLAAVNDILIEANAKLRQSMNYECLVLIVDGLDHLVRRPLEGGTNTHERLFIHRSSQLASLSAHTIYTVPISLYYSPLAAQLEQTIGEFNLHLPMIRLRESSRSELTLETPGMKKMWEILEKRCERAKVDIKDVFDSPETGHYLCQMSGGHPRYLMMFIQAASGAVDALPITRAAAERAVSNYANSLFRQIPDNFWAKLRKFDKPQKDIPRDDIHQQMLFLLYVFEYMNATPWYEVNPVVRQISKFAGRRG